MRSCLKFTFCLVALIAPAAKADEVATALSKVVLIGDSIRLSYAPIVAAELAGKAIVVSPPANGGDSNNVLKHLDAWVIREQPDVVHFNCGIHDTKKFTATGMYQVSPEQYESKLREIVKRVRTETNAMKGTPEVIGANGVHLTEGGRNLVGKEVARFV